MKKTILLLCLLATGCTGPSLEVSKEHPEIGYCHIHDKIAHRGVTSMSKKEW